MSFLGRDCICWMGLAILLVVLPVTAGLAQTSTPAEQAPRVFTLEQAVDDALQNYPAIRASLEQVSAARSGITLAKTNYMPRADMLWQGNRATRNNVFGLLLPQSVISPISGPVLASTSNQS